MKIVVAIIVFNRFENIRTWINCWKQCDTEKAELVIVHNFYNDQTEKTRFQFYCNQNNITYVPRNGQGFDIGAFQDVCRERLTGFPDYDFLLWCCDDTLPMSKDFIQQFIKSMQPGIGVSAMQISKSVAPHVRTTGFMISREVVNKIQFPADPVSTKQHCYLFEHRGGKKTFTEQIRAMGLDCVMVSPVGISPLWDSQHPNITKRLDRLSEFNTAWNIKQGDKVVFICPIFSMYPQIISSLICQTHTNWQLLLIHNGPLNDHVYDIPEDSRIKFIVYPEQTGRWGHPLRQWALKELDTLSDADYVVIQNADNYLTPRYTEYLLNGFKKSKDTVATYCSGTVHSYKNWEVIPAKLERGYLDCGAVMVRKNIAMEVGWRSMEHSSDWLYFEDIAARYSWKNFKEVKGVLFVHN